MDTQERRWMGAQVMNGATGHRALRRRDTNDLSSAERQAFICDEIVAGALVRPFKRVSGPASASGAIVDATIRVDTHVVRVRTP
jgi:hypothetical protein